MKEGREAPVRVHLQLRCPFPQQLADAHREVAALEVASLTSNWIFRSLTRSNFELFQVCLLAIFIKCIILVCYFLFSFQESN